MLVMTTWIIKPCPAWRSPNTASTSTPAEGVNAAVAQAKPISAHTASANGRSATRSSNLPVNGNSMALASVPNTPAPRLSAAHMDSCDDSVGVRQRSALVFDALQ